jgi:RNA polymerase sigma factor (TIGR02999 family)
MPMEPADFGTVSLLLHAWKAEGDDTVEEALFGVVEPELRRLAESAIRRLPALAHRLEPAELVNEAYIRLHNAGSVRFANRRFFYAMAVKIMRHILLDLAKQGGQSRPRSLMVLTLGRAQGVADAGGLVDAVGFYDLLDRLREKNPAQAEALEMHYVAGWTLSECAEQLGLSTATLKRQLAAARQWFAASLGAPARY